MSRSNSDDLNKIKLFLILGETTKASQSKLEEEIRQKIPGENSVQNFLRKSYENYDDFEEKDKSYLRGFMKTLNPDYPKKRKINHFPCSLDIFDINGCYQIARTLLNLPNLSDYEELTKIRNKVYHETSLEINDEELNEIVEKIEKSRLNYQQSPLLRKRLIK